MAKSYGYLVLSKTGDQWLDDWDGWVHPTIDDGKAALSECWEAGYEGTLVRLVEVVSPLAKPADDV